VKIKVRIPKPPVGVDNRDKKKFAKITLRLNKKSEKVRTTQIKAEQAEMRALVASERALQYPPGTALNSLGDRRGMHLAENPPDSEHMRRVRSMRRLWNKKLPTLQCNGCSFAAQCPQFKAGYECAFLPFLNSHKVDSLEDVLFYMKEMLGSNMRRSQLMMIMETLSGGTPSLETTESMNMIFMQAKQLHDTMSKAQAEGLEIELEGEDSSIIGRIFGGIGSLLDETRHAKENIIDVDPIHVETRQDEALLALPSSEHVDQELISELAQSNFKKSKRNGQGTVEVAQVRST
jgi:hypothetical protein